jgi:hypothetical protein
MVAVSDSALHAQVASDTDSAGRWICQQMSLCGQLLSFNANACLFIRDYSDIFLRIRCYEMIGLSVRGEPTMDTH